MYKPLPLIFNNFNPRFFRFQARIVLYFWHKHPYSHFFRYFQNNQISVNPKTRWTSGCHEYNSTFIPLTTEIVQTTVSSLTSTNCYFSDNVMQNWPNRRPRRRSPRRSPGRSDTWEESRPSSLTNPQKVILFVNLSGIINE